MEREVVDYGHTISGAVIVRCSVLVVVLLESSVAPRELLRVGVHRRSIDFLSPCASSVSPLWKVIPSFSLISTVTPSSRSL